MFSSLSISVRLFGSHLSFLQFRLSHTSHPSLSLSLHHCPLFSGPVFLTGECLRTLLTPLWRYLSLSSPSTCGVNVLSWPVIWCVCFNMYTNLLAPSWPLPLSPSPFFLWYVLVFFSFFLSVSSLLENPLKTGSCVLGHASSSVVWLL